MPTKPTAKPKNKAVIPRKALLPSTALTVQNASIISMKYSGGPSLTACSAIKGDANVTTTVAIVPATNEPMADVARAAPARPFLAILLPSMAVTIEPDSPGVLSKIDVVLPPYIAP